MVILVVTVKTSNGCKQITLCGTPNIEDRTFYTPLSMQEVNAQLLYYPPEGRHDVMPSIQAIAGFLLYDVSASV